MEIGNADKAVFLLLREFYKTKTPSGFLPTKASDVLGEQEKGDSVSGGD